MFRTFGTASTLMLALSLAGCDSRTAPGDGTGMVQIQLSRSGVSAASFLAASVATLGNVNLEDVESMTATLTRVEALRQGADEAEEDGSAWVTIELETPIELDLLALPTSEADALELPGGEIAAGTYHNLRLYLSDATITFVNDVTIGPKSWAAGTAHPLRIPGPSDTRVLVPTGLFTVPEGGLTTIAVLFDPAVSVKSITATPNFVMMSPVLVGRTPDEEAPEA